MVMPPGDRDCAGCFADLVKLTRALVRDLAKVVKEVKVLGEHEEESSQKITELGALCKMLREDAQKMKEENTKLEGMVESRDELITEIANEIVLDRMGEDAKAEDENDDNGGDTAAPPVVVAPPLLLRHLLLVHLRRSSRRNTL
jgi:Fic family protein